MKPGTYTYKNVSPEAGAGDGALVGKKAVIQPNISVRGWLTNAGSLALEGFVALEDATVITRLKGAGAILMSSSRMSELGFGLTVDKSVEALSTGEGDIALITDTMGETRVAAAKSGLFGFKPSFGIVSRLGLIGLVPSMECCGIVARTPEDIVAAIGAIAGQDANDFSMPDEKLPDFARLEEACGPPCVTGVIKESVALLNDRETRAFRSGLARLEQAGCIVREVSFEGFGLFRTVHNVVGSVEASSSAGKYDGVRYGHRAPSAKNWNDMYLISRGESFGPLIKSYLFQGAYFQYENYSAFENACRIRRRLVAHMASQFEHVDFLAFPARRFQCDTAQATTINETYDAFTLTLHANVTGQPCLEIPFIAQDSGDDLGLQLVGPRLSDARLLAMGIRLFCIAGGGR